MEEYVIESNALYTMVGKGEINHQVFESVNLIFIVIKVDWKIR